MNLEKYRLSIRMIEDYTQVVASDNVPAKRYYVNSIYRCCETLNELIEKLEDEELIEVVSILKAEGTE